MSTKNESIYEELLKINGETNSLDSLIKELSAYLSNPLALINDKYELLSAFTLFNEEIDKTREVSNKIGEWDDETINDFDKKIDLFNDKKSIFKIIRINKNSKRRLVIKLVHQTKLIGYLIIIETNKELESYSEVLLEEIRKLVIKSLLFLKDDTLIDSEEKSNRSDEENTNSFFKKEVNNFFFKLVNKEFINTMSMSLYLENKDINLSGYSYFLIFKKDIFDSSYKKETSNLTRPQNDKICILLKNFFELLIKKYSKFLKEYSLIKVDSLYFFVGLKENTNRQKENSDVRDAINRETKISGILEEELSNILFTNHLYSLFFIVGRQEYYSISTNYDVYKELLDILIQTFTSYKVYFEENYKLLLPLMILKNSEYNLSSLINEKINLINDYDNEHNTSFLLTLFTYIKTSRSLSLTSKILFLHKNTINYRIKLLNNEYGLDLSDYVKTYNYIFSIILIYYLSNRLKELFR